MDNNLQQVIDSLSGFDKIVPILNDVNKTLKNMSEACQGLSSDLGQINSIGFNDFLSSASSIVGIGGDWKGFTDIIREIPSFTDLATKATTIFSSAMTFLTGPVGIATAAIGLLVGAFLLFGNSQSESEKQTEVFLESEEKRREEIDKTTESLRENAIATKESVDAISSDYSFTLSQVDELVSMSGKDGYAGNIEKAKYLVDEINKVLPNSVQLAEDGKVVWKDMNGAITDNVEGIKLSIEALKERAIVEEYQQRYLESLREEKRLTQDRAVAQTGLEEAEARLFELRMKSTELTPTESAEMEQLNEKTQSYKDTISSCNQGLMEIKDASNDYIAVQQSLSGTTTDMANFMVEDFTKLDEFGNATWESLATGVITLDAQLRAHYDGSKRMSNEEVEASKLAKEALIEDMVQKAEKCGVSYDEMESILREKNISMSQVEREQLKLRFDLWNSNNEDLKKAQNMGLDTLKLSRMAGLAQMNQNDQEKLKGYVELFAKTGNESGILLCRKLADSLEESGGEIDGPTQDIINMISNIDNIDPEIIAELIGPSDRDIKDVRESLNSIPQNKKVEYGVETGLKGFTYFIRPNYKAAGGFVNTGELFVAREAGPELVGRINGKTAVANNDQIVSGISSGVFNAVRSAMTGSGGKGNMNIHATFVMDGEVVGKQVIKYHNGVVRRTGTTPLMI